MPITQRSYYGAAEQGRQDKQAAAINMLRQQGMQQEMDQTNRVNSLLTNPSTTPEQFARAGRTDVANFLRSQKPDPREQAKEFATQMVNAAKYSQGVPAGQTKPFIERNFPLLAQTYGPEWATASDDQVRQELTGIAARFGVQAGIAPQQPKERGLITTVGADGKPIRGEDVVGAPVYQPPRSGIKVTGPDGSEIQIGGDGTPDYGAQDLGKATRTNLEKAFVDAQGNAYALREQLGKYRDEFSTLGGRAKAAIAGAKDYIGVENAPQQQQYLNDFTSWKADTASLLSQYLNQLSGAAISPAEEARLKAGFPNADDGPSVYKSKADATMRRFALVQARAAYLLSKPGLKLDSISLDGVSNLVLSEANKLAASLERGGMSAEAAKQKAIADTKARFGMGQ